MLSWRSNVPPRDGLAIPSEAFGDVCIRSISATCSTGCKRVSIPAVRPHNYSNAWLPEKCKDSEFYLRLLQTPIKDRYASLFKQVMLFEGAARRRSLAVLST